MFYTARRLVTKDRILAVIRDLKFRQPLEEVGLFTADEIESHTYNQLEIPHGSFNKEIDARAADGEI
jgi:hypothetical protein